MKYNFDQDKSFFTTSPTYLLMQKNLADRATNMKVESTLLDISLKLWAESVIKHNLSIGMCRIDPIELITDENSKEIKNSLGKIINKSKDKRTQQDWSTLQHHTYVNNIIVLSTFDSDRDAIDVCKNLKDEYDAYKEASLEKKTTKTKKLKM